MVVYVALTAVEITRNFIVADPLDRDDVGFSSWEEVPAPDGSNAKLLLRWSEPHSVMYRPVEGPVLGLLLYRPEDAEGLIDFDVYVDGEPLETYTLGAGAYSFRYYLPAVLAPEKWSRVQARWAESAAAEAELTAGGWFAQWQELKPWRRPPAPPAIEIVTTLSAGPSSQSEPAVPVQPAIGIATVEWLDDLPASGTGFHGEETDAGGNTFSWTHRWASLPLRVAGAEAILRIRAIHPGIEGRPVGVTVFWNGEQRATVSLSHTEWVEVAVDLGAAARSEGVLSLHVDRTWNPARAGVSEDRRELGIAFGEIAWR